MTINLPDASAVKPAAGAAGDAQHASAHIPGTAAPTIDSTTEYRVQESPSLRYWVHLVAPGWNVIGGGEPSLPGVSIGHTELGALAHVRPEDVAGADLGDRELRRDELRLGPLPSPRRPDQDEPHYLRKPS